MISSNAKKVVFLDVVHPILSKRLTESGFFCIDATNTTKENCIHLIRDAYGIVIRSRFTINEEFLQFAPNNVRVVGYEINPNSAQICKILYPTTEVVLQRYRGELTLLDGRSGGSDAGESGGSVSYGGGDRGGEFGRSAPSTAPAARSSGGRTDSIQGLRFSVPFAACMGAYALGARRICWYRARAATKR